MSVLNELLERAQQKCELCGATDELTAFAVEPSDGTADQSVLVCHTCQTQIEGNAPMNTNHWRCLNDSMWSPHPAVQVLSYRLLHQLSAEGWPQDLLDMMYLDDATKAWADAGLATDEDTVTHRDSNGAVLVEGDNVTLIKDLDVKGAGFTAKRGTLVKNIRLTDDPKYIEGKINGTQIVLVAAFLKKSS